MWLAPTCPPGIWQRCLVWFAFPRFEAVQGLAPKMHQKMEQQTLEEVEWDLDFVRMTMTTKIIGGTFGSCWASCYFLLEAGMRFRWYTSTSFSVMIQGGNDWAPSHVEIEMPGTFFSGTWENIWHFESAAFSCHFDEGLAAMFFYGMPISRQSHVMEGYCLIGHQTSKGSQGQLPNANPGKFRDD